MLCPGALAPTMPEITFTLNGNPTTVSYEPGMDFLEVLRAECGVVSAKNGCAPEGACGCCAVLVDGQPVLACLRKPEHMAGPRRGHARRRAGGDAPRIERSVPAWKARCSAASAFPASWFARRGCCEHNRTHDREEVAKSLDAHLCRCTGYARIIDAIQTAGEAWNDHKQLPRDEPRRHSYFGEEYGLSRNY